MSDASVQKVLVCVPGGSQFVVGGDEVQGPCPAGQGFAIREAYLQSAGELPKLDIAISYQAFGSGFGIVVLFFLVGRGVGEVLSLIRRG